MKQFALAVFIVLLLVLQTSLFPFLQVYKVKPDLLLIFVILFSFFQGSGKGMLLGFSVGIVQDMFSGGFLGFNAFTKMLIGYLSGNAEKKVFKENNFVIIFIVFFATFAHETFFFLLYHIVKGFSDIPTGIVDSLKYTIIPVTLYNTVLAIIFIKPLKKVVKFLSF